MSVPRNSRSFRDPNPSHRRPAPRSRQERESVVVQTAGTAHRQRIYVKEPCTLLPFLLQKLSGQSGTSVKNLLKHRCVLINDAEIVTQFDRELVVGDYISILSANESKFGLFHPLLKTLYEDDFIMAVEKGSGLLSVDVTGGGAENACDILDAHVKKRDPQKRIYVVHRLDRDTSGVMLFAKCREAQSKLVADWNDRVLERTYIAVSEGAPEPPQGTLDSYLYQDDQMVVHSTNDPSKGLRAITHYKTLRAGRRFALLQLDLETGRTNQIRVHLQSIGHSIIGDEKYGATTNPIGRLALHARKIRFYHPITQKILRFEVPEPAAFGEIVDSDAL